MRCPNCAETIQADAKICRFCQRAIGAKPTRQIGRLVGISALIIVGLIAAFVIFGSTLNHGTNTRLYAAMQVYGTSLSLERADELVDKIITTTRIQSGSAVNLSRSDAQDIAIGFARGKVDPDLWDKAMLFSVAMVHFKPSAFPTSDMSLAIKEAALTLASAFADPSQAAERLAPFGLMNGTQSEQVSNLAAQGDFEGARKALGSALNRLT
jgi:hypothetical protein